MSEKGNGPQPVVGPELELKITRSPENGELVLGGNVTDPSMVLGMLEYAGILYRRHLAMLAMANAPRITPANLLPRRPF